MELLALIALAGLLGAGIASPLLLRRSKHADAKPRRQDFLENPNEWGW